MLLLDVSTCANDTSLAKLAKLENPNQILTYFVVRCEHMRE